MAFKLALSAGHYIGTAGKRCLKSIDPNETREWWLNDRIADRIETLLGEYDGIEILRLDDTTGQKHIPLKDRSDASNKWKADFYLAVHHNAGINGGSGGGICAYAYNGSVSASTLDWQKKLYDELIKLTGLKGNRSTGTPRSNLHECREPYAPAVLLELGFMDSTTDVPIILTQDFAYKCAQACVNVIVAKAGLKKKASTQITAGSEYKVVTKINKYATAADALNKTNVKGTYEPGTYYIFNKYPNGVNGMYNISADTAGASAGAWIDPAENKVEEVKQEVQKLYRVRKSKDDAKTQKGAFSSLPNAKTACQEAGIGYHVFDWNFEIVYSYTTPAVKEEPKVEEPKVEETPKVETAPTPTPKKVYELDFPIKHLICTKTNLATSEYERAFTQVCELVIKNNSSFDINIVKAFFDIAPVYGIDPVRAISQSILETGWFKYQGSAVKPEHHNYCGLGVTVNGQPGNIFDTTENGVRAQLQHLFAYGSKEALPGGETLVDQRFKYVTRGVALTWEELAGRWAVPGFDGNDPELAVKNGTTYGQKIDKIYQSIITLDVSQEVIEKYFSKPADAPSVEVQPEEPQIEPVIPEQSKSESEPEATPELQPEQQPTTESPKVEPDNVEQSSDLDKKEIDTNKVNTLLDIITKILTYILDFFRKK